MDDGARRAVVERLRQAVDAHDIEAVVNCFALDYRNVTPAHPARGFDGQQQVRANWTRIFEGVPDIQATVLRTAVEGREVWSEWEMQGTRRDGLAHLMRGVIVFDINDDRATSARFYLEPVDQGDEGVDAAVGQVVGAEAPR
ncbi:MAG: nuclear transport factor 2 family protein [Acidimicrobiales bacterium]